MACVHEALAGTSSRYMRCLRIATGEAPVQVAESVAQEWAIFKVGTAENALLKNSDAWAYVLKGRASKDEQPSDFERRTMERSCSLVLEVPRKCTRH